MTWWIMFSRKYTRYVGINGMLGFCGWKLGDDDDDAGDDDKKPYYINIFYYFYYTNKWT